MNQHQAANYATERASLLFGCYRRGDANDPDTYVAAVAAVLSMYEPDIIRDATDPRTGIQTDEKFASFMPNAGELKRYCDGLAARKDRLAQLAAIPAPIPASRRLEAPLGHWQGELATVFVPEGHARYAKLVEWTATAAPKWWRYGLSSDNRPGLWIPWNVWRGEDKDQIGNKFDWANIKPNERDLTLTEATRKAMAERFEPPEANP